MDAFFYFPFCMIYGIILIGNDDLIINSVAGKKNDEMGFSQPDLTEG